MKGDFTRLTFDEKKHYRKVMMQQGRVQLDSDWNEQVDIDVHHETTNLQDIIGGTGTLLGSDGFRIAPSNGGYTIGQGRYYVDGILCENEDIITVNSGGYPAEKKLTEAGGLRSLNGNSPFPLREGEYLVYLDVWERLVTGIDDDSILELALGGIDTTVRVKTVWQVKLLSLSKENTSCSESIPEWNELVYIGGKIRPHCGALAARLQENPESPTPCVLTAAGGYQRLENQLYRVEIHDGGSIEDGATFKWSRDNGAMLARFYNDDDVLYIKDPGKDARLGFTGDQLVEITDDNYDAWEKPGILAHVNIARDQSTDWFRLNLIPPSNTDQGSGALTYPSGPNAKIRRWDSEAIPIKKQENGYIPLESGIEIRFSQGKYRTGDYWLIPLRANKKNELTKYEQPCPPDGTKHHYARLAVLSYKKANEGDAQIEVTADCRHFYQSLSDVGPLFYVGGDGQEASLDNRLASPLIARVGTAFTSLGGIKVRFKIKNSEGQLEGDALQANEVQGDGSTFTSTPNNGLASCRWTLDNINPTQHVEAVLVDASGKEIDAPSIQYSATLPTSFYYVSGDGLEVPPGSSIQVRAGFKVGKEWSESLGERPVRFSVIEGDGALAQTDTVSTQRGIATNTWTIGKSGPQRVEAVLYGVNEQTNLPPVSFNATVKEIQVADVNTGLITLYLSNKLARIGPFYHGLNDIKVAPAVILGKIPDPPTPPPPSPKRSLDSPIAAEKPMVEATRLEAAIVEKVGTENPSVDAALAERVRAEWAGIRNVEYMEDLFARELPGNRKVEPFKAVDIDLRTFYLLTKPIDVKEPEKIMLRWWAIPAQMKNEQEIPAMTLELSRVQVDPSDLSATPIGKSAYAKLKVKIMHSMANLDHKEKGTVKVNLTWRGSSIEPEANETGIGTGIFVLEKLISEEVIENQLQVKKGETITAKYKYSTSQKIENTLSEEITTQ